MSSVIAYLHLKKIIQEKKNKIFQTKTLFHQPIHKIDLVVVFVIHFNNKIYFGVISFLFKRHSWEKNISSSFQIRDFFFCLLFIYLISNEIIIKKFKKEELLKKIFILFHFINNTFLMDTFLENFLLHKIFGFI